MKISFIIFKQSILLVAACFLMIGLTSQTTSLNGKVGATKKPGHNLEGCFCHSFTSDPSVGVGIKGPSVVSPGASAIYTVWVTRGNNKAGGFNVAAWEGGLSFVDTTVRNLSGELSHAFPKSPENGSDTISWQFSYTAPNTSGTDTLYANGINVDSMQNTDHDYWNYAPNFVVRVENPLGMSPEKKLLDTAPTLFPNPTSRNTSLALPIKTAGIYSIWIQDIDGKLITPVISSAHLSQGLQQVPIEANGIAAGHYQVVIQANSLKHITQLIILP